tara:strand:- start:724 stop:2283 length:1560 start_codon:yes stop_codon:yes gene_type:complete
MNRCFALIGFVCYFNAVQAQITRYNVLDFGAKSDTSIISTDAIQSAIDSCYKNGGGEVYFPAGGYTSGTIVVKSQVDLSIIEGATLYASRDINDYRMPLNDATKPVLIYANGAQNISISGRGEINGRAKHEYKDLKKPDRFIEEITENAEAAGVEMKRYYAINPNVGLINIANCKNVSIRDITVRESSFWSVHLVRSSDIEISAVKVYSSLGSGVNADGLDINSCQRVFINNCIIETGDDAIVLKSRYTDPCQDVTITNCTLTSSSTALKIGTESRGDFKDISFENCKILNSNRGLSIVVLDGAKVENVRFSNIDIECKRRHFNWWGNADPIWLYVGKRYDDSTLGEIRNVTIENVTAKGMGTSKVESAEGVRIHDIRFNNIQLHMQVEDYADKRADHAFYARALNGLTLNNINVSWQLEQTESKWKSAIYLDEINELKLSNTLTRQGLIDSDVPAIHLVNVTQSTLDNVRFEKGTSIGVLISGNLTKNVSIGKVDDDGFCVNPIDYQGINKSSVKENQ